MTLTTIILLCLAAFCLGVFLGMLSRFMWIFIALAFGLSLATCASMLALLNWMDAIDWSAVREALRGVGGVNLVYASTALAMFAFFILGIIAGQRLVYRLEPWVGLLFRGRAPASG